MSTRLYRSRDDRMLAGVAGGLAELWDADPSLVRVVWAVLVILTGGVALVVYVVMAIVVPEEDELAPGRPFEAPAPPGPGAASGSPAMAAGATGPDWQSQRAAEREARRAARQARRVARDPNNQTGAIVIGGLLVALGAFFLVREYLPSIDFDWVWPVALVVLGVFVLMGAFRREGPGPGRPE